MLSCVLLPVLVVITPLFSPPQIIHIVETALLFTETTTTAVVSASTLTNEVDYFYYFCLLWLVVFIILIARISLVISENGWGPLNVGILKSTIVLPRRTISAFSRQEIELILLHELSHIRRWDNLFILYQNIIKTLYFFHPLLWWIDRQLAVTREQLCDSFVLQVRPDKRIDYAQVLYQFLEWKQRKYYFTTGFCGVHSRVKNILNKEKFDMNKRNIPLLSVSFVIFFIFTIYYQNTAVFADSSPMSVALQEKLEKRINVSAENADFSEVINSICNQLEIKAEIDSRTLNKLKTIGVSLQMKELKGKLVLKLFLTYYKISYIGVNENTIFIADRFHPRLRNHTKPEIKKFMPYKHEKGMVLQMKSQFLDVRFTSSPLPEIMDFIRTLTGLNIIIHPQVYAEKTEEQMTIDLNIKNSSVLSIFETITKITGIEFFTENGVIIWGKKPQEFITKTYEIKDLLQKLDKDKIIHTVKQCCEEKYWEKGLFAKIDDDVLTVRNRNNVIPRITWALGILNYDAVEAK
ncbi:M56 family metallopeptidase [Candidatus Uabimicrobium sp. HlEnr_7]|uniref:M56 family metallopeptidase n=1 Tax=Candidatus Uabimicrobium helgolandensis TaxID=3095367 RepID=UPI003558FEEA